MNTCRYVWSRMESWMIFVISILLGIVFLYAGGLKVQDPWRLADAIYAFQFVPRSVIVPFALALPMIEILTGLLLLIGWQRRRCALAILFMTAVFAIAITSALVRGLTINCSCFGEVGVPTRTKLWTALGRDVLLFLSAYFVYSLLPTDKSQSF